MKSDITDIEVNVLIKYNLTEILNRVGSCIEKIDTEVNSNIDFDEVMAECQNLVGFAEDATKWAARAYNKT